MVQKRPFLDSKYYLYKKNFKSIFKTNCALPQTNQIFEVKRIVTYNESIKLAEYCLLTWYFQWNFSRITWKSKVSLKNTIGNETKFNVFMLFPLSRQLCILSIKMLFLVKVVISLKLINRIFIFKKFISLKIEILYIHKEYLHFRSHLLPDNMWWMCIKIASPRRF